MKIDPISPLAKMLYTRGNCHSLAFALNTILGAGLVIAVNKWGEPDHLAVEWGGKVLDINGLHTEEEFEDLYGSIVPTNKTDFANRFADSFVFTVDEKSATSTAELVVETYGLSPATQLPTKEEEDNG